MNDNDYTECNIVPIKRMEVYVINMKRIRTFVRISRYALQKHIHLYQHIFRYQESAETRRGMAFQNYLRELESAGKK